MLSLLRVVQCAMRREGIQLLRISDKELAAARNVAAGFMKNSPSHQSVRHSIEQHIRIFLVYIFVWISVSNLCDAGMNAKAV